MKRSTKTGFAALITALWISAGLIGAGWSNAYFQRKFVLLCEGRSDLARSLVFVPTGPINMFVAFFFTGFGQYGWSLSTHANPRCEISLRFVPIEPAIPTLPTVILPAVKQWDI